MKMLLQCFFRLIFYFSFLNVCLLKSVKEAQKHECPYPVLKQNGSDLAIDVVRFLNGIAEIKFNGVFGKAESKRYCKIKCISGEWVGPLCLIDGGTETSGDTKFYPVLKSCSSHIFLAKFVLSYRNKTISDVRDFPHNSVVQVRCKKFGVFKLIGDAHLLCHNGAWKHRIPTCIPTTSLTNFTDESAPPSVLAEVISGSASIEPTGELAVYPGSTVHLECLYRRSSGQPEWSWTSTYRSYKTGWSINEGEREWKYRLSIFYIKPQDTGIYTCSTPKGLTHSIVLNVIEIHCDVSKLLTNDPNILIQMEGSRLGQSATYQCREGFKLNGTSSVTCQASGIWSGDTPECIPVVCPVLEVENMTIKLIKQDFSYGGVATFQCPAGQKLIGVAKLVCLISGEWSGNIPTCKEVFCPQPIIPQNGKLKYEKGPSGDVYKVGAEISFTCDGNYKIIGKEKIKCQEFGVWSNPPPFCKVRCVYPGNILNGRFIPLKAEYEVGDRILLTCAKDYEPSSKVRPKCQKNGLWSEANLECRTKPIRFSAKTKENNVIIISKPTGSTKFVATSKKTTTATTTTTTPVIPTSEKFVTWGNPYNTTETLKTNLFETSTSAFSIDTFDFENFNLTENQKNINDTDFFYVIEEQPI